MTLQLQGFAPSVAHFFEGKIVYISAAAILSAAEIVNDTLLRIRSKTVEIELFEAEFDVDFFAFR